MTEIRKLLVPITDRWDWQLRAACRGMDSSLFFRPEKETGSRRAGREARAMQVCRGCPVLDQCRTYAVAVQEPFGIWGGMSVAERRNAARHLDEQPLPATAAPHRRHA